MNAEQPKKMLIILLGAIGDVTRALPLAVRIKKSWPATSLHWAIEPKSRGVIEGHPAIDKLITFERSGGLAAYIKFVRQLRAERYDLVLDMQRILKSGIASKLTGAKRRVGFSPRDAKEFNWLFNNTYIEHASDRSPKIYHYQKFGDLLGLPRSEKLEFALRPAPARMEEAEQILRREAQAASVELQRTEKRFGVILGSSWASRFWFVAHYADVIRKAQSQWGMQAVLLGAAGEVEFARELKHALGGVPVLDLVNKTSLNETVALLAATRFAIGPDSGPMHIADAVGIPVISLWGATSPKRSRPEGSQELVLQSAIGCSPCYRRECPGLGRLCMLDIPSEAVLARIGSILGNAPI